MPVGMTNTDPLLLRQTVLDTTDARGLAEFYGTLLGLEYRPGDEPPAAGEDDERGRDWLVLRNPGGAQLAFQQVDDLPPSTWPEPEVPQQLHSTSPSAPAKRSSMSTLARWRSARVLRRLAGRDRPDLRLRRPLRSPVLHLRGAGPIA